ncbi:SEC-C metal-binding domain-containing protein [Mesobacillus subterraneus]|uniref:SEC-C metal-binding domain-containing protein n=1 Tax=Mesobacillus subterraneus TaxID=285983 RepID=UPI001CFEC0FC|nr:SEC-C metal-binding domain-containing protein [Mesobacillus subterraneus]WLR56509.1 SEC-C metal-binding domain-containing protein [Mesobacillus subterraneus]
MVNVPAFCDNCTNIFPSGFVFENCVGVTMSGCTSQCPRCGYSARVPDGVFNFYNSAIEVLEATPETIRDLKKLFVIVDKASRENIPPEEVHKEIEEEAPKLSFLAKYLPKNAKEFGVYLTAVASLIGGMGGDIEINPEININPKTEIQYFTPDNNMNQQHISNLEVSPTSEMPNRKIGRNEPCPCLSGLKYKYCHGK